MFILFNLPLQQPCTGYKDVSTFLTSTQLWHHIPVIYSSLTCATTRTNIDWLWRHEKRPTPGYCLASIRSVAPIVTLNRSAIYTSSSYYYCAGQRLTPHNRTLHVMSISKAFGAMIIICFGCTNAAAKDLRVVYSGAPCWVVISPNFAHYNNFISTNVLT